MSLLLCNNEEDGKERYLAGALMVGLKMVRTSSRTRISDMVDLLALDIEAGCTPRASSLK
jgi:hypothetical protein